MLSYAKNYFRSKEEASSIDSNNNSGLSFYLDGFEYHKETGYGISVRLSNVPSNMKIIGKGLLYASLFTVTTARDYIFSRNGTYYKIDTSVSDIYVNATDNLLTSKPCGPVDIVKSQPLEYSKIEVWKVKEMRPGWGHNSVPRPHVIGKATFFRGANEGLQREFEACVEQLFQQFTERYNNMNSSHGFTFAKVSLGTIVILAVVGSSYFLYKKCSRNNAAEQQPLLDSDVRSKQENEVSERKLQVIEKSFSERLEAVDFDGDIPDKYLCIFTREIMDNPISAADGFHYNRSFMQTWIDEGHVSSPKTGKPLSHFELSPDFYLTKEIEEFVSEKEKECNIEHTFDSDSENDIENNISGPKL